jgi:hypothetical protein
MGLREYVESLLRRCDGCTFKDGEVVSRRLLREDAGLRPDGSWAVRWRTNDAASRAVLRSTPTGRRWIDWFTMCGSEVLLEREEVIVQVANSAAPEWVEVRTSRFLSHRPATAAALLAPAGMAAPYRALECKSGSDGQTCCCKGTDVYKRTCAGCGSSPNHVLNCHCKCEAGDSEASCTRLGRNGRPVLLPAGSVTRELVERADGADRMGRGRHLWVVRFTELDKDGKKHEPTGECVPVLSSTVIGEARTSVVALGKMLLHVEWEPVSVRAFESTRGAWPEVRIRRIVSSDGKRPPAEIEGEKEPPFHGEGGGDDTGKPCTVVRNGVEIKGTLVCVKNEENGAYSCTCMTYSPNSRPPKSPPAESAWLSVKDSAGPKHGPR